MTFNKIEYDNNYQKENYDRMLLTLPKGDKERIKNHAKNKGYESTNKYIRDLIYQDMERGGYPE